MREALRYRYAVPLDIGYKHSDKAIPPQSRGFAANVYASLDQKIFDISQRKRMTLGDELKRRIGLDGFALDLRLISSN